MKNVIALMSVILTALIFVSATAKANLLVNGSFEDNHVPHGKWRWFTSDQVNGWGGANIEIWDHLAGEQAYHGSQFIELNAHPKPQSAFTIFQDFSTVIGQSYVLSFAYQARQKSKKEAFLWEILDLNPQAPLTLASSVLDDHTTDGWSTLHTSFWAQSNFSRIRFTAITPSILTQGNLLDDIKITAQNTQPTISAQLVVPSSITQISEPSTLLLLCFGFLYLMVSRCLLK